MSESTESIERHRVIKVNEDDQTVFYRRNGKERSIKWEPRFGTFPRQGDKLKLVFGGYSIHAKLKRIERCGHEHNRKGNWFTNLFRQRLTETTNEEEFA